MEFLSLNLAKLSVLFYIKLGYLTTVSLTISIWLMRGTNILYISRETLKFGKTMELTFTVGSLNG